MIGESIEFFIILGSPPLSMVYSCENNWVADMCGALAYSKQSPWLIKIRSSMVTGEGLLMGLIDLAT